MDSFAKLQLKADSVYKLLKGRIIIFMTLFLFANRFVLTVLLRNYQIVMRLKIELLLFAEAQWLCLFETSKSTGNTTFCFILAARI